ncbi:MAG: AraC family transcriptional regulator [Pseudomonadales bacterium]|nr:AraC family transcriptional regulator [Pseudomonadales bacterium]
MNQAASSLVVSLKGDLEFWTPKHGKIKTQIALIPAGQIVSVDHFDQPVACCYLDPLNRDFSALKTLMQGQADGIYYGSRALDRIKQSFSLIYERGISPGEAYRVLMTQVIPEFRADDGAFRHLAAIEEVIAYVKAHPTENSSNQMLADLVGLSESQLQRQFKAITGIPIRRFRLWHRLFVTATLMGFGLSLTDASLEAGFSDSSHFNHTFKSMLGMKPSFILKRRDQIKILAGGDQMIAPQISA